MDASEEPDAGHSAPELQQVFPEVWLTHPLIKLPLLSSC